MPCPKPGRNGSGHAGWGRAPTGAVVQLGHAHWAIENEGFNELATRWHADHVYRHEPTALLVFTLLVMLCLNVFLAFYRRDLKPAARAAASRLHVARQVAGELYASPSAAAPRAPPPAPPSAPTAHTNLHQPQFDRKPFAHLILPQDLRNRCVRTGTVSFIADWPYYIGFCKAEGVHG